MPKGKPREWPSVEQTRELLQAHGGVIEDVARALKMPDGLPVTGQALRSHLRRSDLMGEAANLRAAGGNAHGRSDQLGHGERELVIDDPAKMGTLRELLEENGISAQDWMPIRGVLNRWGDPANYFRQVKVNIVPRIGLLTPVRSDGWRPPPRAQAGKVDEDLSALVGDDHCPWHDVAFNAAFCEWLREFKPAQAFHVGDLLHYERLSQYLRTPRFDAEARRTNQAGYDVMRSRVQASTGTRWTLVPGNHDDRLRKTVLLQVPELHALARVKRTDDEPDEWPVLSIPFLLRLDELGVDFPTEDEDWERHEADVAPGVIAVHAGATKRRSGQSAMAAIEESGISTYMGHVHRQGIVWRRQPRRPAYFGCEIGLGGLMDQGYGKKVPDWHPGFATNSVVDGFSRPELAVWTDEGRLIWRNWDCKPA